MNRKILHVLLTVCILIGMNNTVEAQVTIGSNLKPEGGSLLDLKEFAAGAEDETSNRGFLYPRVKLMDAHRNDLHPMYDLTGTDYTTNKEALKKSHIGLVVFNMTTGEYFSPGLYYWNGFEWRRVDDSPAIEVSLTDLLCANATMSPSNYSTGVAFDGIVRIPYLGGTGGTYIGTAPEGGTAATNNLSIERIGGKLSYGGGELMYRVSGTPTVTSPATTTFALSFLDKTCDVTVGSGAGSVNLRDLTKDVYVNSAFGSGVENSNTLSFGDIIIAESGSYAFSLRLYGRVDWDDFGRRPYYVYLLKNNKATIIDATEIDLVTVKLGHTFTDYSYSVTLGGTFEAGDKVIISMHGHNPAWLLKKGSNSTSPVRTSLIYWKL